MSEDGGGGGGGCGGCIGGYLLLHLLIFVIWFIVYFCYVFILTLASFIDFGSIFFYGSSLILIILCVVWASKIVQIKKEKRILARIKETLSRNWK
jgi:hypothetical protein